jgi:hypothetical protein
MIRSLGINFVPYQRAPGPLPPALPDGVRVTFQNGAHNYLFPRFTYVRDPARNTVRTRTALAAFDLCSDMTIHPDIRVRLNESDPPMRIGDMFTCLHDFETIFDAEQEYYDTFNSFKALKDLLVSSLYAFDLSSAPAMRENAMGPASLHLQALLYINTFLEGLQEERMKVARMCATLRGFIRCIISLKDVQNVYLLTACSQLCKWDEEFTEVLSTFKLDFLPEVQSVYRSVWAQFPEIHTEDSLDMLLNINRLNLNNPEARLMTLTMNRVEDYNLALLPRWRPDVFHRFMVLARPLVHIYVETTRAGFRPPAAEAIWPQPIGQEDIFSANQVGREMAFYSMDREFYASTIEGTDSSDFGGFEFGPQHRHPIDEVHQERVHAQAAQADANHPPRNQDASGAASLLTEEEVERLLNQPPRNQDASGASSPLFSDQTYSAGESRVRDPFR